MVTGMLLGGEFRIEAIGKGIPRTPGILPLSKEEGETAPGLDGEKVFSSESYES
jgi:hypothetical protein